MTRRRFNRVKTGCSNCRSNSSSRVKCDEKRPSCTRCRVRFLDCGYALDQNPNPNLAAKTSELTLFKQPPEKNNPFCPSPRDNEMLHAFQIQIVRYRSDVFCRSLWERFIVRSSQQHPAIWNACLAAGALQIIATAKIDALLDSLQTVNAREQRQRLLVYGLQHYSMAIDSIKPLALPTCKTVSGAKSNRTRFDRCVLLATTILLGVCSLAMADYKECTMHITNASALIQHWEFWKCKPYKRSKRATRASLDYSDVHVDIGYERSLIIYLLHIELLVQATLYPSSPFWAPWKWEPAVVYLQLQPLETITDAYLELTMIWLGTQLLMKEYTYQLYVYKTHESSLDERRKSLVGYHNKWLGRFTEFSVSSNIIMTSPPHPISLLRIESTMTEIYLNKDISQGELYWDSQESQISQLLDELEDLVVISTQHHNRSRRLLGQDDFSIKFTAIVTSCAFDITKICRHPKLRRRAFTILRTQRYQELSFRYGPDMSFFLKGLEALVRTEEIAWHNSGEEKEKTLGCKCQSGTFVCHLHRAVEAFIVYLGPEKAVFKICNVYQATNNLPLTEIPLQLLDDFEYRNLSQYPS